MLASVLFSALTTAIFLPYRTCPQPSKHYDFRAALPRMDVEKGADWASAAAGLLRAPLPPTADCALSPSDFCEAPAQGLIVLLRHGESEWNGAEPGSARFTGWHDVPLSTAGVQQAVDAAKVLQDHGVCVQRVYTSTLKRTIKTAWTVLETLDAFTVPITQSWRLNERMYGALTGLNKVNTQLMLGDVQFEELRRDPPPLDAGSSYDPSRRNAFRSVPPEMMPLKESFEDTRDRMLPCWQHEILPAAQVGEAVLVISSKNLLRTLLMSITDVPPEQLMQLDIENGVPLVYDPEARTLRRLEADQRSSAWPAPSDSR